MVGTPLSLQLQSEVQSLQQAQQNQRENVSQMTDTIPEDGGDERMQEVLLHAQEAQQSYMFKSQPIDWEDSEASLSRSESEPGLSSASSQVYHLLFLSFFFN